MTKVREYALAGIPEYWIIDPETKTVSMRVLAHDTYELRASAASGGRLESSALAGFVRTWTRSSTHAQPARPPSGPGPGGRPAGS